VTAWHEATGAPLVDAGVAALQRRVAISERTLGEPTFVGP